MNKPELLIPCGNLKNLILAVKYGADACYIGGEEFSLRAKADNFTEDEMIEAINYCKSNSVKIYITANIIARNNNIDEAINYFKFLNKIKPHAVIISDIGLFKLAKDIFDKDIDIHISTQANNTNYLTCDYYYEQGAKRVVLARELTLEEIKQIKNKINKNLEIECFIHGAMCISYSGRCLLSSFMTGRSSNLGECTHPCRWKYQVEDYEIKSTLIEEKRPNDKFDVIENNSGTYIFNSKDLCMIEHIDDLIESGIDSFKIEGRMKTSLYLATVTRTYRKAIDDYLNNKNDYYNNIELYKSEIKKCTYREYTTGFYYGYPNEESQIYDNNTYIEGAKFFGVIDEIIDGYAIIEQKNKFSVNDEVEILTNDFINIKTKVIEMYDYNTNVKIESCPHSKQLLKVMFDTNNIKVGDIIRSI